MAQGANNLRLGIFVFLGTVLVVVIVFLVGSKDSLFSDTYTISAYFKTIGGLRNGAPVRLSGITVGSVSTVKFTGDPSGKVEVQMKISEDAMKFLKTSTRATIESEGLVGNQVIVLQIVNDNSEPLKDKGTIIGVDPLGYGAIIDETKSTLENTKELTRAMAEIMQKVNEGDGTIGRLINDDDLYQSTIDLMKSAEKSLGAISTKLDTAALVINSMITGVESVVRNVDNIVGKVDQIVVDVNSGKGLLGQLIKDSSTVANQLGAVLSNVVSITEDTRLGTARFAENMEALKRNWLFKSYFEQRGYYDKPGYEKELDDYLKQINNRIRMLDERIETLKNLEKTTQPQKK